MRGRGIDFEHRFNTSRWAEDLLIKALNNDYGLLTVRIGLSAVKNSNIIDYDNKTFKVPDLLVYKLSELTIQEKKLIHNTDLVNVPLQELSPGSQLRFVVDKAMAALEVEFSPYKAAEMKGRDWKPKTMTEWKKRPLKNATPPTAPNIFVKEEDLEKLLAWEREFDVPIVIAHLFDQEAFAVRLHDIEKFDKEFKSKPTQTVKLQLTSGIFKKLQSYDRTDAQGAREEKMVFRVTPYSAVKIGDIRNVKVSSQLGISSSKKYVSQVQFSGGKLDVSNNFLKYLQSLKGN